MATPQLVALGSRRGRRLLAACACGSTVAFLDTSVVAVALPTIGRSLRADVGALQWTVSAYALVLASLVLVGGALGDRLGRQRVFRAGVVWFAVASGLCALAPTTDVLVACRALQGVGGALLVPTSLALLQTELREEDRARAIGLWSGATTLAVVAAPLVGGALVALDWRWVFAVNLPVSCAALLLAAGPGRGGPARAARFDVAGAALAAVALAALTWALIGAGARGASPAVLAAGVLALVAGAGFVVRERRAAAPVVPLALFTDRTSAAANAFTLCVYAALAGQGLLVTLQLQVSLGWSALTAGAATLPGPLLLGLGSGRAAALGQRLGARAVMTAGAACSAGGLAVLALVDAGDAGAAGYATAVLPGVLATGVGSTLFVAPLTATVLAAAPQHLAGAASAVNNAVARTAGLVAVAALPVVVGLRGTAYRVPDELTPAYRAGMLVCAGLVLAGGACAWLGLARRARPTSSGPVPPPT